MTTTDGSAKFKITDMRTHHALGEIVALVTTPPDYEHLLLCDGQTISAEDYPELVEALGSNVLPNLNGRVLQGGNTAGEYKEAGLPNIEGTIGQIASAAGQNWGLTVANGNLQGAFYLYDDLGSNTATSIKPAALDVAAGGANVMFKASRHSAIYGASSTVQPPAYTVRYYICYG